jgi:hypothetical protein
MKNLLTIVILFLISGSAYYGYQKFTEEEPKEPINQIEIIEADEDEEKETKNEREKTVLLPEGIPANEAEDNKLSSSEDADEQKDEEESNEDEEAISEDTDEITRSKTESDDHEEHSQEGILSMMVSDSGCGIYKLITTIDDTELNKALENDLECPSTAPSISPDEQIVLVIPAYMPNKGTPALEAYDLANKSSKQLMTFYNDSSAIQFLGWNPGGNRVAIGVMNFNKTDYPEKTKLFVLTLVDGAMVAKDKYNIPMDYICVGEECIIDEIVWDNEEYIEFKTCDERPCKGGPINFEKKWLKAYSAFSIDPNDPLCTSESEDDHLWDIHPNYEKYDQPLGSMFTAFACGQKRVNEVYGSNKIYKGHSDFSEGYVGIRGNEALSEGFKKALSNAGFEYNSEDDIWDHMNDTHINNIDYLRNFTDEDWVGLFAG